MCAQQLSSVFKEQADRQTLPATVDALFWAALDG